MKWQIELKWNATSAWRWQKILKSFGLHALSQVARGNSDAATNKGVRGLKLRTHLAVRLSGSACQRPASYYHKLVYPLTLYSTFDHSSYSKNLYNYHLFYCDSIHHQMFFKHDINTFIFARKIWLKRMVKCWSKSQQPHTLIIRREYLLSEQLVQSYNHYTHKSRTA